MKHIARLAIVYQLLLPALATSALLVLLTVLPTSASADTISAQTLQVLPPGANSCPQVTATDLTPYIYNGALDSFEFTVPDASYVALAGTVGNTPIPFQFMTRHVDAQGNLRIHVDINSTAVYGSLPLQITLLSADGSGQPVCAAVVSMLVGSGPTQTTTGTSGGAQAMPVSGQTAPSSGNSSTYYPSQAATSPVGTPSGMVGPTQSEGSVGSTVSATSATSVVAAMQHPAGPLCSSIASAYRLWLVLLVIFALIVGALLWAEFPMAMEWARTPERIAAIILVLLLLLLGFWYFSSSCRAALWMPLLAFLIAILGLLAAFWNHPRMTQLLLIEDSSS